MNASPTKKAKSKRLRRAAKPEAITGRSRAQRGKPAPRKTVASRGTRSARNAATAASTGSAPTLLSGGNPQIPKGDGDAPVQSYIAAMPGWKRALGRQLDALVTRTVPNVRKAVRWNSPFYGVDGQGWFLSFHCFAKYVKLTFLRGTSLRPLPPVESKHPSVRYFHVHEADELDEKLVGRWIEQASKQAGDPLF